MHGGSPHEWKLVNKMMKDVVNIRGIKNSAEDIFKKAAEVVFLLAKMNHARLYSYIRNTYENKVCFVGTLRGFS